MVADCEGEEDIRKDERKKFKGFDAKRRVRESSQNGVVLGRKKTKKKDETTSFVSVLGFDPG